MTNTKHQTPNTKHQTPNTPKGQLYVVATPIGNMKDITLRAIDILSNVDLIAAEDTRNTGKLLAYHHIKSVLISCHEHNEKERIPQLIEKLKQGESVALVSDAGTPTVSDPGYHLIREAIANQITVIPIPGVSAAITALSVAGLPTDTFLFIGFLPKKQGKRLNRLKELANEPGTLVFYESPARILSFIEEVIQIMGNRHAVLCREMTKIHEEFVRGSLSEISLILKARDAIKGECVLLVQGFEKNEDISIEMLQDEIEEKLGENLKLSDISKQVAEKYGFSRKKIYEMAMCIKKNQTSHS